MTDGKGPREPPSHFASDRDWQDTDYWYNRVVDAKNPASNTANPSALALITFGLTTALLQVLSKPYFRSASHSAHMSCLYCFIENDISKVDAQHVQKDAKVPIYCLMNAVICYREQTLTGQECLLSMQRLVSWCSLVSLEGHLKATPAEVLLHTHSLSQKVQSG